MKFQIETAPFLEALKTIQKVAPSETITMSADKNLVLSASSIGASIMVTIPAKVSAEGKCTLPYATLEGVLKKRKEATFELGKDVMNFKASSASKYAGNLTLVPYQDIKVNKEDNVLKLQESELSKITQMVSNVALTSVNLKKQDTLPICIKLSKKGIETSCASRNHMAYAIYSKASFKEEHEFVVSPTILPLIDGVAGKEKYKLSITPSSVYAGNDYFRVRFVTQQAERFVTLESVKKFLESREEPEATLKTKTENVSSIFQNLLSLYEVNSFINLSSKDGKLVAQTKTKFGEASEAIEGELKGKIKKPYDVHPKVIEDLLNKCKTNKVKIGLHSNKSISIEASNSDVEYSYSCSVSAS